MGIKKLSRFGKHFKNSALILFIFVLTFVFFSATKTFAQNVSDNMKFVRVAISDSNFKSFVYNEVSIVATAEYSLYDKQSRALIAKFKPTDVVKIKYNSKNFEVIVNNKIIQKNIEGTLVFDSRYGLLGVENLKRNAKQALYHGVLELIPKNDCQFFLINVLDLQNYLKGVVPNEMPVKFGLEALKAQAVAARNYVLMPRTRAYKEFDVDDSVASQVYYGANTEMPLSNQAVEETSGLVALYGWDLILAQYCSTAGGYTENYENTFSDGKIFPAKPKPYLKGFPDILSVVPLNREEEARLFYMSYPDSYDMKSPYYRWQRDFTREELEQVLAKTLFTQSKTGFVRPEFKEGEILGELKEIKVNKRGVSGKVMELEIISDKGNWHVSKELVIRRTIKKDGKALPSANIVFENLYDINKKLSKIVIYGGGYGHGVGMSQYGAGFMATSLHKTFDKILKRYYTGITISTIPIVLFENSCNDEKQTTVSQEFYAPANKAFLIVDNKYNLKSFSANINGRIVSFELANNVVPLHRMNRIDISSYIKKGKNNIIFMFPENENNKAIRLYIELVEKDVGEYNF